MADFQTHLASSALLGAAYGAASHVGYDVPLPTAILAGGLVTIGGVLPDVDSDNAIILRESLALIAAITPMMMLDHFRQWGWTNETIVLASATAYLGIRFGFGRVLKRYTVHRGMWHSIPAAGIAGVLVFMLCACTDTQARMCKSTGMMLGYIWHLVLDEISSVESTDHGRVRIKRSFGTALKFFGRDSWANISTYGKLILLLGLALGTTPNPWFYLQTEPHQAHEPGHGHYSTPAATPLPSGNPNAPPPGSAGQPAAGSITPQPSPYYIPPGEYLPRR